MQLRRTEVCDRSREGRGWGSLCTYHVQDRNAGMLLKWAQTWAPWEVCTQREKPWKWEAAGRWMDTISSDHNKRSELSIHRRNFSFTAKIVINAHSSLHIPCIPHISMPEPQVIQILPLFLPPVPGNPRKPVRNLFEIHGIEKRYEDIFSFKKSWALFFAWYRLGFILGCHRGSFSGESESSRCVDSGGKKQILGNTSLLWLKFVSVQAVYWCSTMPKWGILQKTGWGICVDVSVLTQSTRPVRTTARKENCKSEAS